MLLFLTMTLCMGCTAQISEKLSPQDFSNKIKNESNDFIILDVRTDEEVAQGKVPGAQQLDFYAEDFASKLNELDKSTTYYVYCRLGGRSGKAARQMSELGFTKIYDLKGGMEAWLASGLEVE